MIVYHLCHTFIHHHDRCLFILCRDQEYLYDHHRINIYRRIVLHRLHSNRIQSPFIGRLYYFFLLPPGIPNPPAHDLYTIPPSLIE